MFTVSTTPRCALTTACCTRGAAAYAYMGLRWLSDHK